MVRRFRSARREDLGKSTTLAKCAGIASVCIAVLVAATVAAAAPKQPSKAPTKAAIKPGARNEASKDSGEPAIGEVGRCERHSGAVRAISLSADGDYLASVGDDHMCLVMEAKSLKVLRQYGPTASTLTGVAMLRDRSVLVGSMHDKARPDEGSLRIWDWNTGMIARVLNDSQVHTTGLRLSPDEDKVGVGLTTENARLYVISSGSRIGLEAPFPGRKCNAVAFSPDSNTLAAGSGGNILLWGIDGDVRGKNRDLNGETDSTINAIAYSPDGAAIVAGHADGSVRRWRVDDGSLAAKLPAHSGEIHCIVFSPDGKQLATCGADKTIRIWDINSGKETRRFAGHTAAVNSIAFSKDGTRLFSASADKTIRQWKLAESKIPDVDPGDVTPIELPPVEVGPRAAKSNTLRPSKHGTIKVPSAEATAKRIELVRDVYRDDFSKATTPAAKKKLAGKLLAFGRDKDNEASERYAAIVAARDLAIEAPLISDAIEATSLLAAIFEVDDLKELSKAVDQLAKTSRTAEARIQLVEAALQLADESGTDHRYTEADQFLKTADAAVKSIRKPELVRRVREALSRTSAEKAEWSAYQAALAVLKKDANDPAAHLSVGKHLLFVDFDWSKAIPHLAKSADAKLKAAAVADAADSAEPDQQIIAAELWNAAAADFNGAERKKCEALAAYWYNRALPGLTGLRKVKVEKSLKALADLPDLNRGE